MIIIQIMMLSTEQQPIQGDGDMITNEPHTGKINQLCQGWYSNPQICIFGCTYIFAIFCSIMMATQVFIIGYHYWIGKFLCFYILYIYVRLAFSNPGLARQKPIQIMQNYRFCQTCNIYVRKHTRHCEICDVCVQGYDHHCIFIGKCIGSGNMGRFKQFLCMIFCTLGYAIVMSIIITSNIKTVGNKQ